MNEPGGSGSTAQPAAAEPPTTVSAAPRAAVARSSTTMPSTTQSSEAAGYYARNFETVIDLVAERYADLLDPAELRFLAAFYRLSEPARRLYVRLASRVGPCFRRDTIDYPEIADPDVAADELESAGLLDRGHDEEAERLLQLLRKAELVEIAATVAPTGAIDGTQRKPLIVATLVEVVPESDLRAAVHSRIDILRPRQLEHVRTFRLLFFGNLHQDWREFVLEHLGLFRYEPYDVRLEHRLFPDRRSVDDTLTLLGARETLRLLLDAGDEAAALELAMSLRDRTEAWHPTARPLLDRLFVRLGRHLERAGDLDEALAFYRCSATPPSRERQARILARRGREAAALHLVERIGREPRDESERWFAERFEPRLRRRFGLPPERRRRRPHPKAHLRLPARPDGPVETAVLDALATERRPGFFSENWLWKSLFGLAFWDVVFAPLPGVFQHPFQSAPLDLFTGSFRQRRRELVERRLAELAAESRPGATLRRRYREKRGTRNRLVDWSPQRQPLLDVALEVLGGSQLAAVCDRISLDPGRFRRGLPDLFVLSHRDPGFELLEVKAPGDQLRPEQETWIDHLNRSGIPTRILQVSWEDGGGP